MWKELSCVSDVNTSDLLEMKPKEDLQVVLMEEIPPVYDSFYKLLESENINIFQPAMKDNENSMADVEQWTQNDPIYNNIYVEIMFLMLSM